jgi:glycosyltransferase involved in cell wall biosynthesis
VGWVRVRFLLMNAFSVGGTVRTTLNTAAALSRHHDVEVVSVYKRADQPAIAHPPGVRIRVLVDESPAALAARSGPVGRTTEAVRRRLRGRPSRLVHRDDFRYTNFTGLTDLALYRYLKTLRGGVVVGTRAGLNLAIARHAPASVARVGQEHLHHGVYSTDIRAVMRKLYPRLDLYVALTDRDAEKWRTMLGDGVEVIAVPNAVPDTGDGVSPLTEKVVIASGRLTYQKGFDRLMPVWREVAAKHPDWTLRIFGAGYQQDKLRELIAANRLEGSAHLMGHTTHLFDEMRRASVYVMPSRFEGFPMTLLEAMSCGLPPVAYDFPNGARELVVDGVNGRLVRNKDAAGMARALCDLIEDEELRRKLGQQATAAVDGYDLESLALRWDEILRGVAERRR